MPAQGLLQGRRKQNTQFAMRHEVLETNRQPDYWALAIARSAGLYPSGI